MIWTLYGAIVRPLGDSIYPRYSQEVTWNSHLSAWAKGPLVWSLWSTSWTWYLCLERFVLGNVVGIDEDVIQIYDDYGINNICKNFIHKYLKDCRYIIKPFRHYQPFK